MKQRAKGFLKKAGNTATAFTADARHELRVFRKYPKKYVRYYLRRFHKRTKKILLPIYFWLANHKKYVANRWMGWLALLGTVTLLGFYALQTTSPEHILAQTRQSKDALLAGNSHIQELPGPQQWEFGQHDTAHSQQLITFAQSEEEWDSYRPDFPGNLQLSVSGVLYGYRAPVFKEPLHERAHNTHDLGAKLIDQHSSMLAALQDFSEFNCVAYLKFESTPTLELQRIIEQTKQHMETFELKSYQGAAYTSAGSLDAFYKAVSTPKSLANAVQPCQKAQTTVKKEFSGAWNKEKERYNKLVSQAASDISKLQTAVANR